MDVVENVSHWAEFGLAGLVIAALFGALFVIVKWLIAHIDKQAETHRAERHEWQAQSGAVAERVEKATEEISQGIKELVSVVRDNSK